MPTYSSRYQKELDDLSQQIAGYGDYKSQYGDQISGLQNTLANRTFEYDPEKDESYQQYKTDYTRMGEQAMDDTIGKVSARTGGLASSYATSAANQTYNNYMQQLASKIPELRQIAYGRFQDEGTNLRNQLNDYMQRDQNAQNIWNNNLSNLINRHKELTDLDQMDYQRWLNEQELANAAGRGGGGGYGGGYPSLDELMALLNNTTPTVTKPGVTKTTNPALDLPSGNGNAKNTSLLNKTVNRSVTDARTGNGISQNQLNNYNEIVGMLKNGGLSKAQKTQIINQAASAGLSQIQINALRQYL